MLWRYAAEARRLLTPTFLLTAAGVLLLEAAMTVLGTQQAAIRAGGRATIAAAGTLGGALRTSAMQSGSLAGLVVATALAIVLVSADFEAGVFVSCLLVEPRRAVLMARKFLIAAAGSVGFTLIGALVVLGSAHLAQWHYGAVRLNAGSPPWSLVLETAGRAVLVQVLFLATAMSAATLLRGAVPMGSAVLGAVLALAPVCRTPAAPWIPHYWISAWMGFTADDQLQTYLWNSSSSAASIPACLTAVIASLCATLSGILLGMRGDRFLTTTDF
ncbi:hypothetical protein [Streptomyces sp. YGL11-2]|uniref:hypothetical protein n=1 Tax=Streptomyces sp. YGL11-2 TaxID=3414028 RepID=UPI003CF70398